jgi:two-component system LytT family response regulator
MTETKSITAIIVEDEPKGVVLLKRMLEEYCPQVQIAGTAANATKAYEMINALSPDLVFLDVEMPDGSGFHLLKKFSSIPFHVIFTTAYDKYAIPALRISAVDYLLKPISIPELKTAVKKVETKMGITHQPSIPETGSRSHLIGKIALPLQNGVQFVSLDEIIYCESSSNYTVFYLKDNSKLLVCRTLKEYEEQLSPNGFFRIHQSYLINLRYVKQYVRGRGGYVIMQNGVDLPVSVRKKEEFLGLTNGY